MDAEEAGVPVGSPAAHRERAYKCQRCLNHDRLVSRKGHQCPYKDCVCPGCDLNNLRSKLMTVLRERGLNHTEVFLTKKAGRKQHCMLCSFHGERVELRGHKRLCPWAKCDCTLCTIGRHYRDTMAKQTKHRRSQRRSGSPEENSAVQGKDARLGAHRLSKRVAMKRDWRRRVEASRERSRHATGSASDTVDSDVEVDSGEITPTAQRTDVSTLAAPSAERQPASAVLNGRSTTDQNALKPLGSLAHPQGSIWPAPMSGSSIYGLHGNAPIHQAVNMLNPSPFHARLPHYPRASNVASATTSYIAAQQRQATELAVAVLLSQYGSGPSSTFPTTPGFCLSCQRNTDVNPLPGIVCQQALPFPKMECYLNALREYANPSVAAAHPTLPTVLHPAEAWPQAPLYFK